MNGLLDLTPWQVAFATLIMTHLTIVAVTVFLHRAQAHRALDLHPLPAHLFRFWLWLTTGMVTREWVAVHRKHHAHCETPQDPHSPQVLGLRRVFWQGAELYREAVRDPAVSARYGEGTPEDWLEHKLYRRFQWQGLGLMLLIDLLLFGVLGLTVWAVQMLWIPVLAAGVINGMGHAIGYRNFDTPDASTNLLPWGVLIGGEELHNNHHAFPASARLASRWWEFDLGWVYIRLLVLLRLARVKKLAPRPAWGAGKQVVDIETLKALLIGRMHVIRRFSREVLTAVANTIAGAWPVTPAGCWSWTRPGSTSPVGVGWSSCCMPASGCRWSISIASGCARSGSATRRRRRPCSGCCRTGVSRPRTPASRHWSISRGICAA